ncbi:hypothetical protein [Aestuariimicrobium ganziense]|uniref:hypothetical protein n=1 Tax=Aestuariimicrobium ganziense TaxID=2773677 RepID=UPI001942BEFC|nr:hypothetical protein [Aestuariimicrobium ganziense]
MSDPGGTTPRHAVVADEGRRGLVWSAWLVAGALLPALVLGAGAWWVVREDVWPLAAVIGAAVAAWLLSVVLVLPGCLWRVDARGVRPVLGRRVPADQIGAVDAVRHRLTSEVVVADEDGEVVLSALPSFSPHAGERRAERVRALLGLGPDVDETPAGTPRRGLSD